MFSSRVFLFHIFMCHTLYLLSILLLLFRCTTCCWSVYVRCTLSRQGRFQKTLMRPSLSGSRCTQHASYGWPSWHCTSGQETRTRLVFKTKYTNLFIYCIAVMTLILFELGYTVNLFIVYIIQYFLVARSQQ